MTNLNILSEMVVPKNVQKRNEQTLEISKYLLLRETWVGYQKIKALFSFWEVSLPFYWYEQPNRKRKWWQNYALVPWLKTDNIVQLYRTSNIWH